MGRGTVFEKFGCTQKGKHNGSWEQNCFSRWDGDLSAFKSPREISSKMGELEYSEVTQRNSVCYKEESRIQDIEERGKTPVFSF